MSITFIFSASCAVRLDATCGPPSSATRVAAVRSRARERRRRVVDDLAAQVAADVRPAPLIGVEEPMFVVGAIASRSAAWEIQTPADAARAPSGET